MKALVFKTHNNQKIAITLFDRFTDYSGAIVEFEALPEDISPSDQIEDKKTLNWIYAGGLERWFCAKVTVKYRGYEATDYLGACSYRSFSEFKTDPYFFDMVSNCVNEINQDVERRNSTICRAFNIRKLKKEAEALGFILFPKTAQL